MKSKGVKFFIASSITLVTVIGFMGVSFIRTLDEIGQENTELSNEIATELKDIDGDFNKALKRMPASIIVPKMKVLSVQKRIHHISKLKGNSESKAFEDNGSKYLIKDNLKVFSPDDMKNLNYKRIVGKKFNMVVVESDDIPSQNITVVENSESGRLGLITGIIKVKVNHNDIADELASEFNLNIEKRFEHLNLVYFKLSMRDQNPSDIADMAQVIGAQTGVVRSRVEILESEFSGR
jgi:hypothetical protein